MCHELDVPDSDTHSFVVHPIAFRASSEPGSSDTKFVTYTFLDHNTYGAESTHQLLHFVSQYRGFSSSFRAEST